MWTSDLWIVLLCSVTGLYTPGKLCMTVSISVGTWFWLWVGSMYTGESLFYRWGGGEGLGLCCVFLPGPWSSYIVSLQCYILCVAVTLHCNSMAHFHWRRETFFEAKIVLMSWGLCALFYDLVCVNLTFYKHWVCSLLILRNTSAGCCVVLCTLQHSLPIAASNLFFRQQFYDGLKCSDPLSCSNIDNMTCCRCSGG